LIKSHQFNRAIPGDPVPVTKQLTIDFPRLFILALQHFSKDTLLNAFSVAYKLNQAPGYKLNEQVPEEAVYHYELYSILKSWLPIQLYVVTPEINANPQSKRVLISYNSGVGSHPLLIQIGASISKKSIQDHFQTLQKWKKIKNVVGAWLIIFSLSSEQPIWPDTGELNCVYVWHDTTLDWMNVIINNNSQQQIFLNSYIFFDIFDQTQQLVHHILYFLVDNLFLLEVLLVNIQMIQNIKNYLMD